MPDLNILREWFNKIDRDLQFLIRCFREVLAELGERDLALALPWDGQRPSQEVLGKPPENVGRELQVLAIAYHLLNLVEEHAAAEARRQRENVQGMLHEPGLWGHAVRTLREQGYTPEQIARALAATDVEAVLTAHPTEAKRPHVLHQHRALFAAYEQIEDASWTPRERAGIRSRIKVILEHLWRTGEIYLEKPDVLTELEYVMDYLQVVFPPVVVEVQQRLEDGWREAGLPPELLREAAPYPRLRFGNWVGGDRDGHPLVTAQVTSATLERLRQGAIETIVNQMEVLIDSLSLSDLFQTPPKGLKAAIARKHEALPEAVRRELSPHPHEPWRAFAELIQLTLRLTHSGEGGYRSPRDFRDDLLTLREALEAVGAHRIAEAEVDPLLLHVDTFGFHLAALDVRQNSAFHAQAVSELLQAAGFEDWDYSSWSYEKRREFLDAELQSPRPLAPRKGELGEHASAVVECYLAVADYIERHGMAGVGCFIVSMTRDATDLLVLYLFAREVGLLRHDPEGPECRLHIVPLFETLDDLQAAPRILEDYLEHPITRGNRIMRGEEAVQQVMVGYSDSNKDGGIFASQWALNRAQRALSATGRAFGVKVVFFHGRGGTYSRGAGPTHRFLEALPGVSLNGQVRLTEQGEVISQKFGRLPTALYNVELLLAGVMSATLQHNRVLDEQPELLEFCDRLSAYSQEAYRELLESDGFIEFWSQATPIDALECSFIGSRPARRSGKRTLEDLRAIPWVFGWTQSRYYLPGWYGVGAALTRLHEEDLEGFKLLQEHVEEWPFIRYVLYNVETSLASADPEMMRRYASLVDDDELREAQLERIIAEYQRTGHILEVFFGAPRNERRPRLTKTLAVRAEALPRLHSLQIALLREWRAHREAGREAEADRMLPSLLLSINAIASAERTTG